MSVSTPRDTACVCGKVRCYSWLPSCLGLAASRPEPRLLPPYSARDIKPTDSYTTQHRTVLQPTDCPSPELSYLHVLEARLHVSTCPLCRSQTANAYIANLLLRQKDCRTVFIDYATSGVSTACPQAVFVSKHQKRDRRSWCPRDEVKSLLHGPVDGFPTPEPGQGCRTP